MKHIKLTIAYDGTNYCGWQVQRNGVSIQELIQKAVREMTLEENNVVASGRTDAGVHALAQVGTFRTEKNISLDSFRMGINSKLPKDISIISAEEVHQDFHPIRDSKSKEYRYLISEARDEHPLFLHRYWSVGRPLDVRKMKKAAKYLKGKYDFSAFKASDGADESPVKEVFGVRLEECDGGVFGGLLRHCIPRNDGLLMSLRAKRSNPPSIMTINISGSGFLKHMVRNIVGTLVDVGLGKTTPEEFKAILESKDRKKAGATAPAHGLYLVAVEY